MNNKLDDILPFAHEFLAECGRRKLAAVVVIGDPDTKLMQSGANTDDKESVIYLLENEVKFLRSGSEGLQTVHYPKASLNG